MSPRVYGVSDTASLRDVAALLAEHGISCAVVFERGRPVGIISERDLVRLVAEDPTGWHERVARAHMRGPLRVTTPETSVVDASAELENHRLRQLPVVAADGRLAGIITQADLLHASHLWLEEYAANLERLVSERTAQLQESEQRRGDLVDLTVHDIKNWIHAADASLEFVAEDPSEAVNLLPLLRHSTKRIGNLVHTLLDIHRLESGWMPVRFREVPWASLCAPIVAEAAIMARTKSLSLPQSGHPQAIVRCDPGLVERIMLNLLDNAIQAAPVGTDVDIHTERRADGAFRVRVGNRGPVIPPDILSTLFGKYRQDEAQTAKRYGWGLGLSFCKLAIQHHGGEIRAVSPYVDGEGTAFEFALPSEPMPHATLPH
jgi:signal transduction histidine kinase